MLDVWLTHSGHSVQGPSRRPHAAMLDAVVEATEAAREAEGSGVTVEVRDGVDVALRVETSAPTLQGVGRCIVGTWRGVESTWRLRKVERSALYGSVKRRRFDVEGREAVRAEVDACGRLIRSGATSKGHVTPDGAALDEAGLIGIYPDGSVCDRYAATVGRPVPLLEATVGDVLDMAVETVLHLTPVDVARDVEVLLSDGRMLACRYAYRASTAGPRAAVILRNDVGTWALVGREVVTEWQSPPTETPERGGDVEWTMDGGGW